MPDVLTKARLIEVAIELFGRNGLEAVATRVIADAAGAQQSAISYHFGTKEQLYLACAEHIAKIIKGKVEPLLDAITVPTDPDQAASRAEAILCGLATVMMQDGIAPLARFVVREQMSPSPAFTVLYDGAMRHVIDSLAALLAVIAGGRLTDEELQVRCLSLMGQAFAFRFARAALLRITGWQSVQAREVQLVTEAVAANGRAVFADLRRAAADQQRVSA